MGKTQFYTTDPQTRQFVFPDTIEIQEPFATVVPYRSGNDFKVHRTEALANSALAYHKQGAKYQQIDGKWVKVWEFKVPDNCHNCNDLLNEDRDRRPTQWGSKGEWYRSPLWRGTAIFKPYLCKPCFDKEDEAVRDRQKAKAFRAEQKRREAFDALHKS